MTEEYEKVRSAVIEKAATKHEKKEPEKHPWVKYVFWILVCLFGATLFFLMRHAR